MKQKNSQSGFVLYVAMFMMLIISIYVILIINAQYLAIRPARRMMNRLKAHVMALSGLSLAQAYVTGYEDNDIGWETDGIEQQVDSVGKAIISAKHEAGWLKVNAKGIWYRDTVKLSGLLGHRAPHFCSNALNVDNPGQTIVIADRARVRGNVGIFSGTVVTKGSGRFDGRKAAIGINEFDHKAIDNQFRAIYDIFSSRRKNQYWPDSIRSIQPEEFSRAIAGARKSIYVDGSVSISDTLDLANRNIWILGNLYIGRSACVKNLKAHISGNTHIGGIVSIENSTIFGCGDVRLSGSCKIQCNIMCAETLQVTQSARVYYPSLLYLSPWPSRNYSQTGKALLIDDRARVTGTVMTGNFSKSSASARVMLTGRSRIEGLLYTPSSATLYGSISGSILVGKLLYRQKRSVYDGWVMETSLVWRDISGMVLPLLFPKAVPEYLYVEEGNRKYSM